MPWGDGTGPWWTEGNWRCWRRGFGSGAGRGFGRGFGSRMAYASRFPSAQSATLPQPSREQELQELKSYSEELRIELEEIKKRIAGLEKPQQ
jgi:hypothetical protein